MTSPLVPASHRDLLEVPAAAGLTTIAPSGYPQTSAVWFLLDGELIRTSLHRTRQKYRNLVANSRASLFVIDPADPFRTIDVRGDVTIEDDADLHFLPRLLAHYGQTLDTFSAPHDNRVVVTLTPARIRVTG